MRIFHGFDSLSAIARPVVTIGSFDGVHLGHADLLRQVVDRAHEVEGESVVVTFAPHPREVQPRGGDYFRLLTTTERKAELLAGLGVDVMIVVEFTMAFAALTAEEFVRDYLCARLGMHTLVVGYNHRFGHEPNQPADHFERLGERYGFGVVRCRAYDFEGGKVSSSVIRQLLAEGNTKRAEELLGHKL